MNSTRNHMTHGILIFMKFFCAFASRLSTKFILDFNYNFSVKGLYWVPIIAEHLYGLGGTKVAYNTPAAAAAKSLQSCPTLCDPIDGSPPGSPSPGILQARTLEWVAISFSNVGKWKVKGKSLSCVWLFESPWTAGYQAPPSTGFSRQEYGSRVPLPSS